MTSWWIASNSRPSSSIWAGVRCASGLSAPAGGISAGAPTTASRGRGGASVAVAAVIGGPFVSELYLDRALGRVDAGADDLAGRPVHASGPQVPDAARAQAPGAAVADAHAAAVRHLGTGRLAGDEDRLLAVAVRLDSGRAQADRAARPAHGGVERAPGMEGLDVQ